MSNQQPSSKSEDFKLERYKFILQEIHFLNENIHKYLALFQALATGVISAGVAVFVSWQKLNISVDTARMAIYGLLGLVVFLAFFVILFILAGMFSWFDYRKEEVELLDKAVGKGFRSAPKLGNLWRWYETYLILFIIVFVVVMFVFTTGQIIPLIK